VAALITSRWWANSSSWLSTQVSDIYVKLGNDFNTAVAAFSAFGIQMEYVEAELTLT
jgi:hypothetical protein